MKYLTMFSLLLLSFVLYSQEHPYDLPNIVPPSPTVANLMQFEEVPVDHYTGQPDISIPLFSKSIHQDLALNIALKYNTQGVKIDNRSGWTGTGWSLFAGGSISRTVRGLPDEIKDWKRKGIYHNEDFWNYENLTDYQKAEFTWNALGTPYDHYDAEFDLYQFSFLGISGRFIITKEGPQLLSNAANVKITKNQDMTSGSISSFIVTDANGYQYHFDVIEESTAEPFSGSVPQGGSGNIPPIRNDEIYKVRSAWHLSKITTSNYKLLASFDYQDSLEEYVTSYSEINYQISDPNQYYLKENSYNTSVMKPQYSFISTRMNTTTKKLSKITFLDGVTIDFRLGGSHPETNGSMLQHLLINSPDGRENKRFSLVYEQTDRLWLTQVVETPSSGLSSKHILTYFEREKLASFNSDSDPWGYNYKPLVNANYEEDVIKSGLLTHITTPTGGVKEFVWEEHTFGYRGAYRLLEADYVKNPNNTNTQFFTSDFTAISPFTSTTPTVLTTIVVDHAHHFKIKLSDITGFQHTNDYVKVTFSKTNTPENGITLPLKNEYDYLDLEIGTYNVFVQYIGYNIDPNFTEVHGTIQITYQSKIDGPLAEFMLGGGVRIKEIVFKNSPDATASEKRLFYSYQNPNNKMLSSGSADVNVLGSIKNEYQINASNFLFNGTENRAGSFFSMDITYDVKSKGTRSRFTRDGYIGYKHIKISEVNKGYTVYRYTNSLDYPTPANVFSFPFWPATNIDYKRGILLKQEIFDHEDRKLKEIENTRFSFTTNKLANLYKAADLLDCSERQFFDTYEWNRRGGTPEKNSPVCGMSACKVSFSGCGILPNIMMVRDVNFGWAQLKESLTRDYYYDDFGVASVVETKTNYEYNTENYQPKKVTTTISRSGTIDTYVEDRYYAVGGYPTTDFTPLEQAMVTKMASLYKVNTPIYVQNHKNDTLISTVQYGYDEFLPNMVQPKRITSSKGLTPKESRLTYHHYDSYGNPLEVSREDGVHIVYIWGYDYTRPLAKIVNSTYVGMPGDVTTMINNIVALSDTEVTRAEEQTIREQFDLLRDHEFFEDAALISFTYDPLIGVTSQTDPRGYTMTYHYDDFNRLEFVKDAEGKLISENKYRYKNQH